MTMLALLAMMAAQAQPAPPPRLTFFHGEEHLASWLESSEPRRGDRVRSRILRVRHGIQPFWLVLEIDCAANTIATVSAHRAAPGDATLPSFEGDASHRPFRVWYRFERALQAAVLDTACASDVWTRPVSGSIEEGLGRSEPAHQRRPSSRQ